MHFVDFIGHVYGLQKVLLICHQRNPSAESKFSSLRISNMTNGSNVRYRYMFFIHRFLGI